jgi:hypothetical protein
MNEAAHSCGNGHLGCVTKRHLSWKTRSGNMLDMIEHGRSLRGQKQWNAKLTEEAAREILALKGVETTTTLAKRVGGSSGTIRSVFRGYSWAWVNE